ncbi:phage protein Gp27 family protein [Ottowia sp.]|uniref:phage protein Gp27 family protein n=1 Tax=Ottowia sp. TaxID=1898956 RepID=UPI003A847200
MPRKSHISRLPGEVKSYIEAMLATGAQTLDELIADLQNRFPAEASAGTLPSRSAVHRYGQKLDRRLAAIKASTEAARLISEQAGDDKDARSEALTALVQTELFEAILALQEVDEPPPEGCSPEEVAASRVDLLSKAAKNIATLSRSSVNLKVFQAKVEEATRQKLLQEQRAKLDELGRTGDVPPEVLARVIKAAYDL